MNKKSNFSTPAAKAPSGSEVAKLFERHNRELVAFLVQRLGSEAEAHEVAQEAYVSLLQLEKPSLISFPRAYLYRTAANIAGSRLRRRVHASRHEQSLASSELHEEQEPYGEVRALEALALLEQALQELPADYRRAFALRKFNNASTADICSDLGLKTTQVRLYLRRTVAYCRLRIEGVSAADARLRTFK